MLKTMIHQADWVSALALLFGALVIIPSLIVLSVTIFALVATFI